MTIRLDDVNKRIIHALMEDARNVSAPMIASEVGVSPATVRNRIAQLEEEGIIRGYHASVDFEQADSLLTCVYICTAPVEDRHALAQTVRDIPGVVSVRELLAGQQNLHITAIGADLSDLQEIAQNIASQSIEIEDESLLRGETVQGYQPFGPEETHKRFSDFISLTGGSEVIEVTVSETAPIANERLETAASEGVLDDELLVVSIERDDEIITPRGQTEIKAGDLLTLLSRSGITDEMLGAFEA